MKVSISCHTAISAASLSLLLLIVVAVVGPVQAWSSLSMKTADVNTAAAGRREFFQKAATAVVGVTTSAWISGNKNNNNANAFDLPDLPYSFEALEPYIDAPTMKIHHDKHHATYVANLNKATEGKPDATKTILEIQADAIAAGPAIRNNGGGHYNHAFFWTELSSPDIAKNTKPSDELLTLINKSFGSFDEMKTAFEARAAPGALFGSGWVWVCVNSDGTELKLVGTPNQDNPLMKGVTDEIMFPILGLDVWEHAYYLKYQNRRPEYVSNFWNVVNWDKVSANCKYVIENKAGVAV